MLTIKALAALGGVFFVGLTRNCRVLRPYLCASIQPTAADSIIPMRKQKPVSDSFVIMTELVLPNDTNTLNNLMGGRMMHLMDIAAAIAAQKHSNRIVVTASVDNVSFRDSIRLGNVVTLQAQVTRAFSSSMEVHIDVWAEDIPSGTKLKTNEAFFTFVAVDQAGRPIDVPDAVPDTDEEIRLYDGALRRRQLRLVLAGRMKPAEAQELKALFALEIRIALAISPFPPTSPPRHVCRKAGLPAKFLHRRDALRARRARQHRRTAPAAAAPAPAASRTRARPSAGPSTRAAAAPARAPACRARPSASPRRAWTAHGKRPAPVRRRATRAGSAPAGCCGHAATGARRAAGHAHALHGAGRQRPGRGAAVPPAPRRNS